MFARVASRRLPTQAALHSPRAGCEKFSEIK
jgi:hypothetical protein